MNRIYNASILINYIITIIIKTVIMINSKSIKKKLYNDFLKLIYITKKYILDFYNIYIFVY